MEDSVLIRSYFGENGVAPRQLTSSSGCTSGCTTDAGLSAPTFQYDANGNMTCMLAAGDPCDAVHAARYMTWTSFNMVASIAQGSGNSAAWAYGADHQRYKMCAPDCTAPATTTLYVYDPATGGASELVTSGGTSTWHDWIVGPDGQLVAERIDRNAGTGCLFLVLAAGAAS